MLMMHTCNNLTETLQTAIKNCTSFKRTKKKHKPKKPWITPGIIRSINRKQRLFKKYMYTKKESDKLRYNAFRNKLNGIIHRSRKIYFENLLQKSRSNLKKTWSIVNELIGKKKSKILPKHITINQNRVDDSKSVAEAFNNFFCKCRKKCSIKSGRV